MSDEVILRHGSPTLAGIKTANLFTCRYEDKKELIEDLRSLNHRLVPKGIQIVPLHLFKGKVLLYIFRLEKLENDFSDREVSHLLACYGYEANHPKKCIVQLSKKIKEKKEFPHEIGLFLGYPPEDVKGFIENPEEGFKCIGYWKVYGNEQDAKRKFECYKKCTEEFCARWAQGSSMESLI